MSTPLPMTKGRRLALLARRPDRPCPHRRGPGSPRSPTPGWAATRCGWRVPVHGSTVSLSAGAADVQVTQAAGSTLRLTGKARYSLVRSTVTWHTTPSGVIVSPRCHFFIGNCSFSFRAVLPAGKRAVLSDGSGNLTLRGLTGPVSAASGSGDVQANLLSGTVSLRDRIRGHIRRQRCPGRRSRSRTAPATSSSTAWPAWTWWSPTVPVTSPSPSARSPRVSG